MPNSSSGKKPGFWQPPKIVVMLAAGVILLYLLILLLSAAYGFLALLLDIQPHASLGVAIQHLLTMTSTDRPAVYGWRFAISLVTLVLFLTVLVSIQESINKPGPSGSFSSALVGTVAFAPGIAALVTVIAYMTPLPIREQAPWMTSLAVLVGALVGLLIWLLAALLFRRVIRASRMNTRSYGELCQRLTQIDARLMTLGCSIMVKPSGGLCQKEAEDAKLRRVYYAEAYCHREALAHALGMDPLTLPTDMHQKCVEELKACVTRSEESVGGLRWIMGTGYMNLWTRVHRAEEALIQINVCAEVVGDAVYDYARLYKSNVPNCEHLRVNVRTAIEALDPAALAFLVVPCGQPDTALDETKKFNETSHQAAGNGYIGSNGNLSTTTNSSGADLGPQADSSNPTTTVSTTPQVVAGTKPPLSAAPPQKPQLSEYQARSMLREVRCSINTFRDYRWDGLIRARNRCMRTGLMTGLAAYVLLCVAVIIGAPADTVVAATAFYLVGALVGLFSRLRADATSDKAVEDYGLATARLIFVPLFSGLAAIGGVVLINLLPAIQAQPTPTNIVQPLIDLHTIFSLNNNRFGLIVAAIFGLTPGLLIDRLLQSTDQYKVDLQNTEGGKGTNNQIVATASPTATGSSSGA